MLDYLSPDCPLTLRQAIAQLRQADAKDRDVAGTFAPPLERSLSAHDAVHVLFACDTTDRGEAIAHAWMLLGTSVTREELKQVMRTRDHQTVVRDLGHFRRFAALLAALPAIVGAVRRARRMHRRWSWSAYDAYLDTPLNVIRRSYGIALPTPRSP